MNHAEKLFAATKNCRVGNHRVEIRGNERHFIYYNTVICVADTDRKEFRTTTGGWDTSSTKQAIGRYRRLLTGMGYTETE